MEKAVNAAWFRVRHLESLDDAVDVCVKWAREERAAEAVQ
jgi:hypothetical protein